MPVDRPDEDDAAPDARATAVAERATPVDRVPAETRDPVTYAAELRAAVAADRWETAAARFAERWSAHERDYPRPADADTPRRLAPDADAEVDRACDRIRDVEQRVITPAMREIETEDPDRSLVGLDHRLKGPDRLKEKVGRALEEQPDLAPSQAMSLVPDAIRFTFCYSDEHYVDGVRTDLGRLHALGFELAKPLKNSWDDNQYKGINSQWLEPETGQRFEVQFHTHVSFEAKQLTHCAYERIRSSDTPDAELDELDELQHEVCARIPVPPGAGEIEEHPREERNGR
ncbi:MAG: hypothetical protein ABSA93_32365 [Streptosporangiaceae bacterium]